MDELNPAYHFIEFIKYIDLVRNQNNIDYSRINLDCTDYFKKEVNIEEIVKIHGFMILKYKI